MECTADPLVPPAPSITTTPRKQRASACEICNKRKVRCDASVNGVPCSECKSRLKACKLLQSKRSRGPDGRYIFAKQNKQNELQNVDSIMEEVTDSSHSQTNPENTAPTPKAIPDPDISFDIERLLGTERGDYSGSELSRDCGTCSPTTFASHASSSQQGIRVNFAGESWFASYVLSRSTAGPIELHRLVQRRPKEPRNDLQRKNEVANIPSPRGIPRLDLPQHLAMRLIEAYFQLFHVFCPILDQTCFLSSVRDGSVSTTLLRSVFFVASIHCPLELLCHMGYRTRLDAEDDLFAKGCASFDAEQEADRTTMILSSFLLHYWSGKATKYRDALWWLGNAIRSAQCMGFHRSTKNSKMPERNKAHWKRVWWCLYIRDRQVCLSTGPPMVINDLDFDVEDLTMDDFPDESPETARYVIAQASLNKAASNMFFYHCSPRRLRLSHDPLVRQKARRQIQAALEDWYANMIMPSQGDIAHFLNLILKVCYYYYMINLHQRLQRLCDAPFTDSEGLKIVLQAANNVSSLVDDSLLNWSPERFPMIYVSAIFTAMTAYVAGYGASTPPKGAQLSQSLRPNLLALRQFEQCYIIARWVRNLFMEIINRRAADEASGETNAFDNHNVRTMEYEFHPQLATTDAFVQDSALEKTNNYGPDALSSYISDSVESGGLLPSPNPDTTPLFGESSIWNHSSSPSTWTLAMDPFASSLIPSDFLMPHHGDGQDSSWTVNPVDSGPFNYGVNHRSLQFLADLGLARSGPYGKT